MLAAGVTPGPSCRAGSWCWGSPAPASGGAAAALRVGGAVVVADGVSAQKRCWLLARR